MPTDVLVCLDKFRGSATAAEASAAVALGIRRARAGLSVREIPVADGGEGTVDALVAAGYTRRRASVTGPAGAPVAADFAVRERTAVIEMAQAAGSHLLDRPRPLSATTFGVGELVLAALDAGACSVVLAAGGSATTDGGAGMLAALGATMVTAAGRVPAPGGAGLAALVALDFSTLDPRVATTDFVLASDVDSPLLGPSGAAAVFGPQKGATPDDVEVLERGLARFADLVSAATGHDRRDAPGAGAAGGFGFAALAVLGARRVRGIDFVIEQTGVIAALGSARLVVVGEGRLDEQTLQGKAPAGIAALARGRAPVVAVVGQTTLSPQQLRAAGISRAYTVLDRAGGDVPTAMSATRRLLTEIGVELGSEFAGEPAGEIGG